MVTKPGFKQLTLGIVLLAALQTLSACIATAVTAIAVTGIDVALDRRTPGTYYDDNALELKLRKDILLDDTLGTSVNVSVTVLNGIVLLTGEVNNDNQRRRAIILARSYEETRKVVPELELAGKTNITSRSNDTWITGKVKAKLLQTPNLPANAVKVVTEHGKVYLLGLVTKTEAEAAVKATRTISGVTHIVKVFEYIK
jgi:osmotically-inducible protein OsmY